MRCVVQKVTRASVTVDQELVGKIGSGFMVLVGVENGDTEADATYIAGKLTGLRIFEDADDKMNLSLLDIGGEALVISQFTLCADTKKGNRPSFIHAMEPVRAKEIYEYYCEQLEKAGVGHIGRGIFGADMKVSLLNDGPVTIILDTDVWKKGGK